MIFRGCITSYRSDWCWDLVMGIFFMESVKVNIILACNWSEGLWGGYLNVSEKNITATSFLCWLCPAMDCLCPTGVSWLRSQIDTYKYTSHCQQALHIERVNTITITLILSSNNCRSQLACSMKSEAAAKDLPLSKNVQHCFLIKKLYHDWFQGF